MTPLIPSWAAPPPGLRLAGGTVDLWRIDLDAAPPGEAEALRLLSPDERERLASWSPEAGRRRFAAGRAAMRRILAGYLARPPQSLRFTYGEHGKPLLADGALAFNLAHSGGLALLGVACEGALGVDVERERPQANPRLIRRICSPAELSAFNDVAPEEAGTDFAACWTWKEAYVKALGRGLTLPMSEVRRWGPRSGQAPWHPVGMGDGGWAVLSFQPSPGYAGAVVVPAPGAAVRWFVYQNGPAQRACRPASANGSVASCDIAVVNTHG